MNTINEVAQKLARKLAWRFSRFIACLMALILSVFLIWNSYFKVQAGVDAVTGQLSHLVTVGDIFQLKSQLLSLASSGLIERFTFKDPGGTIFSGSATEENSSESLSLSNDALSFHFEGRGLYASRGFDIPSDGNQASRLLVSTRIQLELFLLVFLVQVLTFYGVKVIFEKSILNFSSNLTQPIMTLAASMNEVKDYKDLTSDRRLRDSFSYRELAQVYDSFLFLLRRIQSEEQRRLHAEKNATLASVASQVAHDIRSPVAVMNMVVQALKDVPEDERQLLRSASQRINDIANDLLKKGRESALETDLQLQLAAAVAAEAPVCVASTVGLVVSEKRMQFQSRANLEIKLTLQKSHGVFVAGRSSNISRMVSNLINNSVEACVAKPAVVQVEVYGSDKWAVLEIADNGIGIPENILQKLGKERVSFGKASGESGSGLGLIHAQALVNSYGGKLEITSEINFGTKVKIFFPKTDPPVWHLPAITLTPETLLVTVDDEDLIHGFWSSRIGRRLFPSTKLQHKNFTNLDQFKSWVVQTRPQKALYLIDYEFPGQMGNGLETIESLGIWQSSILVTSRSEEKVVLDKLSALGVRMIPKNIAEYVPILMSAS